MQIPVQTRAPAPERITSIMNTKFIKYIISIKHKLNCNSYLHFRMSDCSSKDGLRNASDLNQKKLMAHKKGRNANPAAFCVNKTLAMILTIAKVKSLP